jgi:acyl dehydratase
MAYAEGDQINEVKVTPDKYLPHRYAGASGDFNPIHIDKEFATAVGLPSTILHGLWSLSQVQRAAIEAAGGDPTKLKALSGQFRGMGVPEKEITVTGTVKTVEASGETIIELEAAQDGSRIIRNATAIIEP